MIFYHHTDPAYLPSIMECGLLARPWSAGAEGEYIHFGDISPKRIAAGVA